MRVDDLTSPRGKAEIFEDDRDALFMKSFMTGDVFSDIPDPDGDGPMTVAIVGHPCAIRGHGGALKTRIPCCVVSNVGKEIPYDEWPDGNFDLFPLDSGLGLGEQQAVRLTEFRPVHRRELLRERRVAALTPRGIYIFQQRFTHSLARVAFPLAAFEEASSHIVDESELEMEWIEHFAGDTRDERQIAKHVKAFHKFLDHDIAEGTARREGFKEPGGTSAIAKQARAEMKRRSEKAA